MEDSDISCDDDPHEPPTPPPATLPIEGDSDTESEDASVGSRETTSNCGALYIPAFVERYRELNLDVQDEKNKLLSENWLGSSLLDEITSYFPKQSDINYEDENKCDPVAFQHNVGKMFPVGRIFASSKQLDQVAEMLLSNWGIKKVHNAKSICC